MNANDLSHIAKLRILVDSMEKDLGLDNLSADERKLLYAMSAMSSDGTDELRSDDMKRHPLCQELSHPTFYRTLKSLLEKGIVSRSGPRKTGTYSLKIPRLDQVGP